MASTHFIFSVKTKVPFQPVPDRKAGRLEGLVYVPLRELPLALRDTEWTEINMRLPRESKVTRAIDQTLTEAPQGMAYKSRGLELFVEKAAYDKHSSRIKITLSDSRRHGVGDGLHTLDRIKTRRAADDGDKLEGYVPVRIWVGFDRAEVVDRLQGIHTMTPASDLCKLDQLGCFDNVRAALNGMPGADEIRYYDGEEDVTINVSDVIAMLEAFNVDRYDEHNHPALYRRPKLTLELFQEDEKAGVLGAVYPNAKEILRLHDRIKQDVRDLWNAGVPVSDASGRGRSRRTNGESELEQQRMRYGWVRCRRQSANDYEDVLMFTTGDKLPYGVDPGLVYPILAAFRANVYWRGANRAFSWQVPMETLVPAVLPKLVQELATIYRAKNRGDDRNDPWATISRSDADTYKRLYDIAATAVARMQKMSA